MFHTQMYMNTDIRPQSLLGFLLGLQSIYTFILGRTNIFMILNIHIHDHIIFYIYVALH